MENQTQENQEQGSNFGCYAVVKHGDATEVLFGKTKKKLNEQIENMADSIQIVGVFKGKQLSVTEKKSFNFS